ncbi:MULTISPECIES: DUF58 domain-containing protein [unclassified Haladaptatus]|uniref:DUF58 domain-containing protein n=1 Tax=unclassified Haladaptatus TaxID=2622732 RepID=UPI00209C56EB|nr:MULTISPECIES: DUF58 domain-containing protein [unclassified Haladaptatus]MCO8244758.1 DUF58 domain-containing protein [Haladaptatus sp. AB643]MCO8255730.1 DUF58 domain-containing protein [Haladaptatus sp. AB618]
MEVTRRYEVGVVLGCLLAGGAWLLHEPLFLLGTAGIGAFLLVQQYRFTRDVLRTTDSLTLTQSASHDRVITDEDTSIVIRATLPTTSSLVVTVEARPPISATTLEPERQRLELGPGERDGTTTFTLDWPVAGRFECAPPMITLADQAGLFRSEVPMGPTATVTVVPRRPRNLHVGAGGDRMPTAFGERETRSRGSGLDPADIRQYVPGDTARRIDWKATARSNGLYVREFDAETDVSTILVVDHRSPMTMGVPGGTKLDYVRHVALAYADHARSNTESVALYTVGDSGITNVYQPEASSRHYAQIETQIHDLQPTADTDPNDAAKSDARSGRQERGTRGSNDLASRLETDGSAFGRNLLPFLSDSQRYVQHVEDDPLYTTARTYLRSIRGSSITVFFTDDTNRTEIRKAVKAARQRSEHVLVFLVPTVLFERGTLHTVDTAYDRYVDFEDFRRGLDRIGGVSAFEVGPSDRIDAILATTRQTNRRTARRH